MDDATGTDTPNTEIDTPIDRPAAARDFDFLLGRWRVHHRRLKKRLAGLDSDEPGNWTAFETDYECWHLLGGMGNIDRQWGTFADAWYEGVSIRSFAADPSRPYGGEWLIYWMDTGNPEPQFQVRGNFDGDSGEFFGEDVIDDQAYPLRFRWWRNVARDGKVTATWDQAYQLPDSEKWEVNWVMEFERVVE